MPQTDLTVTLVQTELYWEQPAQNREHFEQLLQNLENSQLIILPEMFTTGFSMQPQKLADEPEGTTLRWLQALAQQKQAAVTGSLIVKEAGAYFNRLYFVYPSGEFHTYNKRHLFTLAGEEKVYRPGRTKLIVEYAGWRINPQVCYDLRFPVWCRNAEGFDFQYFVANWPARRSAAWQTLLKARAIENMCYVAGLNRVGNDGNGVYHSGNSALHDPLGEKVSRTEAGETRVETLTLSAERLGQTRQRFAFLQDRDTFNLEH